MTAFTVNLSPELSARLNYWSVRSDLPPERLAVELLEEYFDDCDDADRLEELIRSGEMGTYPADDVHMELNGVAALAV